MSARPHPTMSTFIIAMLLIHGKGAASVCGCTTFQKKVPKLAMVAIQITGANCSPVMARQIADFGAALPFRRFSCTRK